MPEQGAVQGHASFPQPGRVLPLGPVGHIQVKDHGDYLELNSKFLERGELCYSDKKKILKEFKSLSRKKPLVAYTKITNPVMMRILAKLGGVPYYINLDFDSIWFVWRK